MQVKKWQYLADGEARMVLLPCIVAYLVFLGVGMKSVVTNDRILVMHTLFAILMHDNPRLHAERCDASRSLSDLRVVISRDSVF